MILSLKPSLAVQPSYGKLVLTHWWPFYGVYEQLSHSYVNHWNLAHDTWLATNFSFESLKWAWVGTVSEHLKGTTRSNTESILIREIFFFSRPNLCHLAEKVWLADEKLKANVLDMLWNYSVGMSVRQCAQSIVAHSAVCIAEMFLKISRFGVVASFRVSFVLSLLITNQVTGPKHMHSRCKTSWWDLLYYYPSRSVLCSECCVGCVGQPEKEN